MLQFAKQPPETVFFAPYDHPVAGPLLLGLTSSGALCRVAFVKNRSPREIVGEWKKKWKKTLFTESRQKILTLPEKAILTGTPFQQKVWTQLEKIAPGAPISYGEMARRLKNPKAAQAVGGALKANLIPVRIPCHRVIKTDGSLGGFSGGAAPEDLKIKESLLKAEGFIVR